MQIAQQPRGKVEFRIIHNEDKEFLFQVYRSTRDWEMQYAVMSEGDKDHFLRLQFDAQTTSYQMQHLGAVHRIIQLDGVDIGRMIVNRTDELLHIIDLAILPQWQGRGIGSDILRSLLNEAHGGKVPVRLCVETQNPALALYERFGFRKVGIMGHLFEMEWRSPLTTQVAGVS